MTRFDLSTVLGTLARAIPDAPLLTWRDRRLSYAEVDRRVDGLAHFLVEQGFRCHTERADLAGHESGQDHVGLYLRNGNEYPEAMFASYRARLAPFNCSYRYVDAELVYLLRDSRAAVLVYNAEFAPRVAAVRDQLPDLRLLIQVADDSGNELLSGAVDYESVLDTPPPAGGMPQPTGDDLYILYTGGTTGMPKGVLWRQHDVFVSSMGGRPFGSPDPLPDHDALAAQAQGSAGSVSSLILAPFMHGAAQWGAVNLMTMGGHLVIPDDVDGLQPARALRLVEREKITNIPIVGEAIARPLIDEIENGDYDLSSLIVVANGGAPVSQTVRERLKAALPNALYIDVVGSSEAGMQMSVLGSDEKQPVFTPNAETAVVSDDFDRLLSAGEGEGWLARRGECPLGYLGDPAKSARTFPLIDGERFSIPGDRADFLDDGRIRLLGRSSAIVNTGGEKVFAEEVESVLITHPDVYDVLVVGRPSETWGSEVVAIIESVDGASPDDAVLREWCRAHIAGYKIPKAFVRTDRIVRSPAGKADYRWAKAYAVNRAGERTVGEPTP